MAVCLLHFSNRCPFPNDINLRNVHEITQTMRRTKVALIYQKTKNLRVIQLLLGHSKLESTVRYPGVEDVEDVEVDDALEASEQMEV